MKNSPCLAAARIFARRGLRVVWSIMFPTIVKALKGYVANCQHNATVPILMTSGSLRKIPMASLQKKNPTKENTRRNTVPTFTVKPKPSRRRAYSPAP